VPLVGEPTVDGGSPRETRQGDTLFTLRAGDRIVIDLDSHDFVAWSSWQKSDLGALEVWESSGGSVWLRAQAVERDGFWTLPATVAERRFISLRHTGQGDGQGDGQRSARVGKPVELLLFGAVGEKSIVLGQTLPSSGEPLAVIESPLSAEAAEADEVEEAYWPVGPGEKLTVDLRGHRTVEIESRYQFSSEDIGSDTTYRIVATAGAQRWFLEHTASTSTRREQFVRQGRERERIALGGRRIDTVDLGDGVETLVLSSTGPVLTRVRVASEERLLFPGRNGGPESVITPSRAADRSLVDFDAGDLGRLESKIESTDPALRSLFSWLARDNRYRGSAAQLAAAELALSNRTQGQEFSELRRLRREASKWIDLLPQQMNASDEIRYRRVLAPRRISRVADPDGLEESPSIVFREALAEASRDTSGAYFLPVPVPPSDGIAGNEANEAREFSLLRGSDPVRLRLLVQATPGTQLTVTGGGEERVLVVDRDPSIVERSAPSLQEAALALRLSETAPFLQAERGELDRFAEELARADRAYVELPPGTTRFRISADRPGAEVAIQRLSDAPFGLGESEYLFWVDHLRTRGWNAARLFAALTAIEPPQASDRIDAIALRSLWNHWLPLARSLRNQRESFSVGIEPLPEPSRRCGGATSNPEEPMSVLIAWGRLARQCAPTAETLDEMVTALRRLDRNALADRLLAQSILFGEAELSGRSLDLWLADRARVGDTWGRVEGAAAASFVEGEREDLLALAEALATHGSAERAIWVASLVADFDSWDGVEAIVQAALKTGWWRTFERHVEELDVTSRTRWEDRRAASSGRAIGLRQAAAPASLSASGVPGSLAEVPWLESMGWRDGSWMVRAAAGVETLQLRHVMNASLAFRATSERPLKIAVPGAASLRLRVRPVASSGTEWVPDSTLVVRRGGREVTHSLHGGRTVSSPVLTLPRLGEASPSRTLGGTRVVDLDLEAADTVEVWGAQGDFLIEVDARIPNVAAPFGVRPSLEEASREEATLCLAELSASTDLRCFREASLILEPEARPQWSALARENDPVASELRRLARLAEEGDPEGRRVAVARGQAIWEKAGRPAESRSLRSRWARATGWRQIKSVQSSAGVRRVEGAGWAPEDPSLRMEKALFGDLDDADLLIVGDRQLAYEGDAHSPSDLRLSLDLLVVPPYQPLPVSAVLEIDGEIDRTIDLDRDRRGAVEEIRLPAGSSSVRVRLDSPRRMHYLKVRVEERVSGGEYATKVRDWRRNYEVAKVGDPLRVRVQGPAWIRIDEFVEGRTVSTSQFVETDGWQSLEVAVAEGRRESLYRVFERVPSDPPGMSAPARETVVAASVPSLGSSWSPSVLPVTPGSVPQPNEEMDDRPSHSVTWAARSRRLIEEDESTVSREEYAEARWTIRRGVRSEGGGRHFVEGGVLGRARDLGDPTAGVFGHLRVEPGSSNWIVSLDAKAFAQTIDSMEWSARLSLAASRGVRWTDRTNSRFRIGAFARELSLDSAPTVDDSAVVDQDLFTDYKLSHGHGVDASFSTTHSLYRDFQLFSEVSVRTNESLGDLERSEAQVGFRQLFGGLRLDVRYRFARFFEDDDRSFDSDRERITLAGFWERWTPRLGRWEIGGAMSYDVSEEELSGRLEFSRHFSGGRGLDDFRPVAAGFQSLRERRARR